MHGTNVKIKLEMLQAEATFSGNKCQNNCSCMKLNFNHPVWRLSTHILTPLNWLPVECDRMYAFSS